MGFNVSKLKPRSFQDNTNVITLLACLQHFVCQSKALLNTYTKLYGFCRFSDSVIMRHPQNI